MISEIHIENFKSIDSLSLRLGSITVFIGENGSGKSNILEAIAFAAAACANKLDDEFLYNRGIRVTDKDLMYSAFAATTSPEASANHTKNAAFSSRPITLTISGSDTSRPLELKIRPPVQIGKISSKEWRVEHELTEDDIKLETQTEDFGNHVESLIKILSDIFPPDEINSIARQITATNLAQKRKQRKIPEIAAALSLRDFLIYSPEDSTLRNFDKQGAIKPLGAKGEGLLRLLMETAASGNSKFSSELKSHMALLGWFSDLQLPTEEDEFKGRLQIQDRWLAHSRKFFDQRSANEGFLYLLFYFTLFLSKETPNFFAVDNIDNALNPKLCAELTRQLTTLAVKTGKQMICTTHNPAILDGLNLHDGTQRLYVVRRNSEGRTIVNRVKPPRPRAGGSSVRLSEAFVSGMLGGIPDHF